MSFGFSPSDIVAFIAFGKKVFDALQTDDGSAFEYRNAAAQCQAFADVMSEVQRLDLSHLPEDFRKQLQGYSKNIGDHVAAFKKHTIDKFEKSMGEETKRGWFKGAPRKVQWAFGYADDLEKFTVSLGAWLQIIQTSIQFRFLDRSMLLDAPYPGMHVTPTAASRFDQPSTQLALPAVDAQNYIEWRPETVERLRLTGTMDAISDMVYERLLSRSAPPISASNKVFTLPPDDGAEAIFLAGNVSKVEHHQDSSSVNGAPVPGEGLDEETREPRNCPEVGGAIVWNTNHYLTELQLPLLTHTEAASLSERSSPAYTGLPLDSEHNGLNDNPSNVPKASRPNPTTALRTGTTSRSHGSLRATEQSPCDLGVGILAMWGVVGQAARLAYDTDVLCREIPFAPGKAKTLASIVSQYSDLLRHAVDLVYDSAPSDRLVNRLFGSLAVNSSQAMRRISDVFGGYFVREKQDWGRRLVSSIRLHSKKRKIKLLMVELESLKLDLTVMLQMYQIQTASRQARS